MKLGVCYYPEHWPQDWWADDARRMREMGLNFVRIGEFAWSRIEPDPGRLDWDWLDRAIETLHGEGLKIVLGTPTATPPKWLVDRDPSMLAVDRRGRPRGFGSRRHYCFSSETYRAECARIVRTMAERYGQHPAIAAWQTDNEYGCHDSTLSYSPNAARRFRQWLAARYGDVTTLNTAWGNVFWSMEYRSFDEVDPPSGAVTETNPAHRLDYQRFASDEVAAFNKVQTDILRALSPGRDLIHNFMGFTTSFDHYDVSRDLDVASWDSYPLGLLEVAWFPPAEKARYLRQGQPDVTGFHHDLYRGVGRGRWWVMEQQPGPVNWGPFNPSPLPGMVRAWTWEAFAHGAEVVSYFRWRQVPFAQEQMHAGLHLPDRTRDTGGEEAAQVAGDIAALGTPPRRGKAQTALIFDYAACWMTDIQPQGVGVVAVKAAFEAYSALRSLGIDVDIISPEAPLDGYDLIVVPMQPHVSGDLAARLKASKAVICLGPRTGSKTEQLSIPVGLPPGPLQSLLPLTVTRVESLRPGIVQRVDGAASGAVTGWREMVRTTLQPRATYDDGSGFWYANANAHYLAGLADAGLLKSVFSVLAHEAGVTTCALPEGVRISRMGDVTFAINFAPEMRATPAPANAHYLLGGPELGPADIAMWRSA